jgi:peptide deformylase
MVDKVEIRVLEHPNIDLMKISESMNPSDDLSFMKDMLEIAHKTPMLGLAAPQIGILKRVILIWHPNMKLFMINPKIIYRKLGEINSVETCLSLPGKRYIVKRAKLIKVEFYDESTNRHTLKVRDELACVIQHEIDHLDGKLILTGMSVR